MLLQDRSIWHRFLLGEGQLLTLRRVPGHCLVDRLLVLADEIFRRTRAIGQR